MRDGAHVRGESTVTILVVEDDEDVRSVISRMLEAPDCHTLMAANAAEALELASSTHIDLLVVDVVLPGISGYRIAGLVRSVEPGLPVVYMSGWSDHPQFPAPDGEPILSKPFSREELTAAVASALGRSPNA